jgi:MFS family permease
MMNHSDERDTTTTEAAVTFVLALAMLLASLGTSIANIALPSLAEAFAAPFAEVQAVVIAYLGGLTVTVVVAGGLGDTLGLRPMLLLGLCIFALASLGCALAPTLWLLIAARALQGIGAAFLMVLSMALMRQSAQAARLGRAMGLLGTVSALGTALGPSLGGVLIGMTGWRGLFWVQVPLAVLALMLAYLWLPQGTRRGRLPAARFWRVVDAELARGLLVNSLVAAVMMTTLVVGPFYLSLGLGLSAAQVGFVMAIGPGISILSGFPAGRLVDGWGAAWVLRLGLALLALGAVLLALLPERIGLAGYILAVAVLTPGYQLFQAANNTAALAEVAAEHRGTVSGLLTLSRNIGLVLGASVMGAVFAYGVGSATFAGASVLALEAGMRLTFLLATGLMVLALAVIGRRRSGVAV